MDEPPPPPGFLAEAWEYGEASTIPRLMLLRARRVRVTGTAVRRPPPSADRSRDTDPTPPRRPRRRRCRAWLAPPRRRLPRAAGRLRRALVALNDPRGTLGTDTGGKLATLHVMEQHGALDPRRRLLGAGVRSEGRRCTRSSTRTRSTASGSTSRRLPMLYAAYPLYLLGGDRPSCCSRCSARCCARSPPARWRAGSAPGRGWTAFWVIGLASPVAIYALDFWEHTLGLGAHALGRRLAAPGRSTSARRSRRAGRRRAVRRGRDDAHRSARVPRGLRSRSAVSCCWCATACARRTRSDAGVASLVGAAVAARRQRGARAGDVGWHAAGQPRAPATATGVGASSARSGSRKRSRRSLGDEPLRPPQDIVFGARDRRPRDRSRSGSSFVSSDRLPVAGSCALAVACCFYLVAFSAGLGFVPGLLTASPFAAVGLVLGWRVRRPASSPLMAVRRPAAGVGLPVLRRCGSAMGWPVHAALGRAPARRRHGGARGSPDRARRGLVAGRARSPASA